MEDTIAIKRALISVSDKSQIIEFAKDLKQLDIEIISTGNTAQHLIKHEIPVTDVSSYTGFPEIMGGRVKTLHPKIHGGILARRNEDQEIMQTHDIASIDLVVVNLYPFQHSPSIENIDVGGVALLRGAAKNHQWVTVVVDPSDYASIIQTLKNNGTSNLDLRKKLAAKVFKHTAYYDQTISEYFKDLLSVSHKIDKNLLFENNELDKNLLSENNKINKELIENKIINNDIFNLSMIKNNKLDLRYGENPHQKASFYTKQTDEDPFNLLQGKALSYNNLVDSDAAFFCAQQFNNPACVIVKHANPCGVALGQTHLEAYKKAYLCDPTSAFGGIIAINGELTKELAQEIIDQQFVEVIIAPEIEIAALTCFKNKPNVRVIQYNPKIKENDKDEENQNKNYNHYTNIEIKRILGGYLLQEIDNKIINFENCVVVTKKQPSFSQKQDCLFAWQVCKYVKSNAIVLAQNNMTLGIGAGQMSRVLSTEIAILRACREKFALKEAVLASDAFFPFPDGVELAAKAGITAIIQPGGSKNDNEVIQVANEHNIAMLFTGIRHFRH